MIVGVFDYLGVSAPILPNTFIGGIGGTITTPTDLANKLSISSANILDFQIDSNNNVSCHINADYSINDNAFNTDLSLTYYIDLGGRCTSFGIQSLYNSYNILAGYFPSLTSTGANPFRCLSSSNESNYYVLSIPLLTPIGATSGNDSSLNNTNCIDFYTNSANATNNGGSPDGDLTSAVVITNLNYVSDTNAPDAVDDLATSNITSSTIDLTWSAPTSTNAIDVYLIFQNGNIVGTSASTSFTATLLDQMTDYDFKILTFDVEGNSSDFSNVVSETTLAYDIPIANIISYWNFDADSTDQVGANDGVDTAMSYIASGGIGNVANFTAGVTSKITVADAANLSFGNSTTDSACSFLCRVKFTSIGSVIQFIRKGAAATLREYVLRYDAGKLEFRLFDQSSGGYIEATFTVSLTTGVWYEFAGTYDGSGSQSGIELYKDGTLLAATKTLSGSYTAMENQSDPLVFGNISDNTTQALNGYEDEAVIFNVELTATQIFDIYNKHQLGKYLTE